MPPIPVIQGLFDCPPSPSPQSVPELQYLALCAALYKYMYVHHAF